MRAWLPLATLLTGCATATLEVTLDLDGDGLLSDWEEANGLDPTKADTDGDGIDDDKELKEGTDPTDALDRPYKGGWGKDACRHDYDGTGYDVGDIAMPFELVDQFGDTLKLADFCGRQVLLMSHSFW